ncbi:hypothetical protein A3D00_00525 [Candidatus Woesebacteria bacterium RIFCSPHIGHO2_02_FULL_38_9]|uniref:Glycosyltransferase 2-like domain-containing protein n=1 Tax=Candidatus Woesebacteria bacterium RIFCSPHIGHO2_01_FULL_39_28 TaxID=1802496 RepID=A0A1F7YHB4_9BACT|nr:MAG: hypothetical protein A2627_04175 [Candidatus Woesebacteria bacterium RIFCSPHIGHO2_01_FULL_39_28]OGM33215.1 MAG: hypothetical protein A3D00_00525 [Candidatus Woesebacteria bacterium RIFCSPHIGHO2_02_FULL_38_9]OGM58692.1 MAG: hypothetical protein A3A50_02830 [Candidatus Woesebacteria bacterium RIFCSPLOWO2_01_FULL_38_20]
MEISVIIVTKNQKHVLEKSLPILLKQKLLNDYEIIIVDSGSTDGTKEYVNSLPVRVVSLDSKSFNYANAFNTGANASRGKYLVRLSGDAIPVNEKFLFEIIAPFVDIKVGGVYGKYEITERKGYGYPIFWPAKRFPKRLTRYSLRPSLLNLILSEKHREMVFNFAGGCCSIRREIWEKRPFNGNLIEAEDAEYSWFLHVLGYDVIYNPKARVIHEHRLNSKPIPNFFNSQAIRILTKEIALYYLKKLVSADPFEDFNKAD